MIIMSHKYCQMYVYTPPSRKYAHLFLQEVRLIRGLGV